ncbi:ATP-dependent DNA ligase [Candidatus Woesearchaeota archaeon]|nr:ATP-dependent DNA ligase [Candidatus Woesearchaeota archaeon]
MEYKRLVEIYEKLESTPKRLQKTAIIAEFLGKVSAEEAPRVVLLLEGKVFPDWNESKLGVASKIVVKALGSATGIPHDKVENEWRKMGDLGSVAESLIAKKKQSTLAFAELKVAKVFDNIQKLASLAGEGTVERKISLITELLSSASPKEARYIIRTVLEEMRVGVGAGAMRDAIIWSNFGKEIGLEENEVTSREEYNKISDIVQNAYDMTNDFGEVAKIAKSKGISGLKNVGLSVGRPLKVMLAIKVKDIGEGFERCGRPCMFEYKYDGFRIQCHKDGKKITLYTRRLENVTSQFPDVVECIKKHVRGDSYILDSEAVGIGKNGYLPFQSISQRIKRKYGIEEMSKKFPVELNVFDIISHNGQNYLNEPFSKRRNILEKIISPLKGRIVVSRGLITDSEKEAERFYKASLSDGNEGLMIKKLDAPYQPGARVGFMVKLKPTMETLDLAIIGAEWGEGKRSSWLSSFTLACRDDEGNYLEVGKVGTGIKEKEEEGVSFAQLTRLLKPIILSQKGREVTVKPKVVVEITYEEIQKSPTYKSGYALRFPRVVRLREERSTEDVSTLDMVEKLYREQKG